MFSFFKKKSPKEQLALKYKNLLEEAFQLSRTNRKASDQKMAEAEEVLRQLKELGD
jgi:hypothetical protein